MPGKIEGGPKAVLCTTILSAENTKDRPAEGDLYPHTIWTGRKDWIVSPWASLSVSTPTSLLAKPVTQATSIVTLHRQLELLSDVELRGVWAAVAPSELF